MEEIYTERKALREYIEWIREERRRLGEEYWKAITRLKELEKETTEELESYPEMIDNLMRVIEKQNEAVSQLNKMVPKVPAEVAVSLFKQEYEEKITTTQIEQERDREERDAPIKRRKQQDRKEMANVIARYLKEREIPVKAQEIQQYLESKGYRINNQTVIMNTAMEYNSKIERATRGYYQYK